MFSFIQTIAMMAVQIAEPIQKHFTSDPQFWATLALVLVFATDMVRRVVQRRWDIQDRHHEKEEERAERIQHDLEAKRQRDEIAEEIKARLELQQLREKEQLDKLATKVISKIESQEEVVVETSEKVATEIKAEKHQQILTDAIAESTEAAHQAYEIANTINHKLEKMSAAAMLDEHGEEAKKEIQIIEDLHEKRKGDGEK